MFPVGHGTKLIQLYAAKTANASTLFTIQSRGPFTSVMLVPKHYSVASLDDFRRILKKCLGRLVLPHFKNCLQFPTAPRPIRLTPEQAPPSFLSHLDICNSYARRAFVDFTSAFKTTIPSKRTTKPASTPPSATGHNWKSKVPLVFLRGLATESIPTNCVAVR